MRVIGQRLVDVDGRLYTKMDKLNMRGAGLMRGTLRDLRRRKDTDAFVNYLINDNKLLAWNLQVKVKSIYEELTGCFNHFYVRKTHRRHQYGERLIKAAYENCLRRNEKCIVSPWDSTSRDFFNSVAEKHNLKLVYRDVLAFNW